MALGETDYGLFGVVGGLIGFVAFFNELLSSAISRYYAYSVGLSSRADVGKDGLEECIKWFNTALMIHIIVPVVLISFGYMGGIWAVRNFLRIPAERVEACVWVFRWLCLSCFIGMASVPYRAMYTAKQEIAELTVYSLFQTTANVIFVYYMATHSGDWLAKYACWAFLAGAVPQLVIVARAMVVFPECKFRVVYLWSWERLKELFIFAAYRFWGALAIMIQGEGMAVLVNKFLGAEKNATMSLGSTVSAHSTTLASAMDTALQPAIANEYGAGNISRMRALAIRACKFSAALVLLFAIPLSLEIAEVLRIWLKNPPSQTASICLYLLGVVVLEKISCGLYMAIFAVGKIRGYQFFTGLTALLVLPLAAAIMKICDLGILSVGIALLIGKSLVVLVRLYFARAHAGISVRKWVSKILIPLLAGAMLAAFAGFLPRIYMAEGFVRLVSTTIVSSCMFCAVFWLFVFDSSEKEYLRTKMRILLTK